MTTRTINLRPWEVLALQAGATMLLRPFRKQPVAVNPNGALVFADGMVLPPEHLVAPWQPGDVLRCRETWAETVDSQSRAVIVFKADGATYEYLCDNNGEGDPVQLGEQCESVSVLDPRWRSAATMPAWASRLSLRVVAVRAVRVAQVPAEAIKAMGIEQQSDWEDGRKCSFKQLQGRFRRRWNEDHPRLPWGEAWAWALKVP